MKFNIGDRVLIRLNPEQLADPVLSQADGMEAEVTEVYTNTYDPETERYEVDLIHPIEGPDGESLSNIPGLYLDNLDTLEELSESVVFKFEDWERKKKVSRPVFEMASHTDQFPDLLKTLTRSDTDCEESPKVSPPSLSHYDKKMDDTDSKWLNDLGFNDGEDMIENISINQAVMAFKIIPEFDREGIETVTFLLYEVRMLISIEYWNESLGDGHEEEIEIIDTDIDKINPYEREDKYQITEKPEKLPITPAYLTVNMKGGWDPKAFKYYIQF